MPAQHSSRLRLALRILFLLLALPLSLVTAQPGWAAQVGLDANRVLMAQVQVQPESIQTSALTNSSWSTTPLR